ncbi:MAG: hypothetical protein ACK5KT_13540 [Dysgonomonas sp.]
MDVENLIEKCKGLESEISLIESGEDNVLPILDGIINIEKYSSQKYKILWILKESNDLDANGKGGGWSLTEAINSLKDWESQINTGKITFRRIIYASYGLLNNFVLWNDMPSVNDDPNVFETIKKIAYINVKKVPGGTTANQNVIKKAYSDNKDLLLKQIELYNPDIIIGGNTLHYFFDDLPIPMDKKISDGKTAYYPSKNRLYIDAYHPAVRENTISEEDYCNGIILAGKDWIENWKG